MINKIRSELCAQFGEVANEKEVATTLQFADRALEQLDSKLTKVNFLETFKALEKSIDALLQLANKNKSD